MTKTHAPAPLAAPAVSAAETDRFRTAVRVLDRDAFVAELNELVQEKLAAARLVPATGTLHSTLREKAAALRTPVRWKPSGSDLQRGRIELLREFDRPHNLPLVKFAHLAHKSRQQIYKDITARRLLALGVGTRGQRLPDWQLDPDGLRLTQAVLARSDDVDPWTLYRALSEPMERLDGRPPVQAVRPGNVDALAKAVLGALGFRAEERVRGGD